MSSWLESNKARMARISDILSRKDQRRAGSLGRLGEAFGRFQQGAQEKERMGLAKEQFGLDERMFEHQKGVPAEEHGYRMEEMAAEKEPYGMGLEGADFEKYLRMLRAGQPIQTITTGDGEEKDLGEIYTQAEAMAVQDYARWWNPQTGSFEAAAFMAEMQQDPELANVDWDSMTYQDVLDAAMTYIHEHAFETFMQRIQLAKVGPQESDMLQGLWNTQYARGSEFPQPEVGEGAGVQEPSDFTSAASEYIKQFQAKRPQVSPEFMKGAEAYVAERSPAPPSGPEITGSEQSVIMQARQAASKLQRLMSVAPEEDRKDFEKAIGQFEDAIENLMQPGEKSRFTKKVNQLIEWWNKRLPLGM